MDTDLDSCKLHAGSTEWRAAPLGQADHRIHRLSPQSVDPVSNDEQTSGIRRLLE
jgi:hypothetical protein